MNFRSVVYPFRRPFSVQLPRAAALIAALLLTACGPGPEAECLAALRLEVGNPDTLKVTANLGPRGSAEPGVFWIRYSSQNGVGGYEQRNLACRKVGGGAARDTYAEAALIDRVAAALMEGVRKRLVATGHADIAHDFPEAAARKKAREMVYQSPDDPPVSAAEY